MMSNISLITDEKATKADRAAELARRAIASVTADTFSTERDGITYLSRAIRNGIETPLTAQYKQAVLDQLGAADLEEARILAARHNHVSGV